ncbi:hypothetical protein DERP_009070 [Dermatophagoides pteronyssinus]|uniref:Uncharacterized protein n=1 Tax=Dermatophagoides pteronyssinus TaxID=6956 RepID=A0ABQ8JGX6_DERPT|nr:hypothetical protein DERP_009070 [Dermatophagoides pteronyssinus]
MEIFIRSGYNCNLIYENYGWIINNFLLFCKNIKIQYIFLLTTVAEIVQSMFHISTVEMERKSF